MAPLLAALTESDLPIDHGLLPSTPPGGGWGDMLRLLAGTLPDQPCIVVLDELPWLTEQDDTFDGHLQITGVLPWPEAQVVGGWWNRQFNPEIDLVGGDRAPGASRVHFCGSPASTSRTPG